MTICLMPLTKYHHIVFISSLESYWSQIL